MPANNTYLEPEYEPHYSAWLKSPTPETAGNLLNKVRPVIDEGLRTYGGASAQNPTLLGKAKRLTLQALGRYDPSRSKLRSHLLTQLQGLRRMAVREDQVIHVPEQLALDRTKMHRGEDELKDRLGRDPTDHELADHTALSVKRLAKIRQAPGVFAEGAMTRTSEDGASTWSPAVRSAPNQRARDTWMRAVMLDLDPKDQLILRHSVGLDGHKLLTSQQIARKVNLSPGAISQRKAKIQNKLDAAELTGLFDS